MKRQVGNGSSTRFWNDTWCGSELFASKFPRLMALDVNKDCFINERRDNMGWNWTWRRHLRTNRELSSLAELCELLPTSWDSNENDRWIWKLEGKNEFTVALLRHCIDRALLPIDHSIKTKWNPLVPKKVNIFIWRLRRNCLPTGLNLFTRSRYHYGKMFHLPKGGGGWKMSII